MPALEGRGIELAVGRTGRRCSAPRIPREPPGQAADDHPARIQEPGHDTVIEGGHDLPATQAPEALLRDRPLALELDQPAGPAPMPSPLNAATPGAAGLGCRW